MDAAINGEFPFGPDPKTIPPKLVLLVKPAYKTGLDKPARPPLEEPPTSRSICGAEVEIPTFPPLFILILSLALVFNRKELTLWS